MMINVVTFGLQKMLHVKKFLICQSLKQADLSFEVKLLRLPIGTWQQGHRRYLGIENIRKCCQFFTFSIHIAVSYCTGRTKRMKMFIYN
jgi:hypothetical protein